MVTNSKLNTKSKTVNQLSKSEKELVEKLTLELEKKFDEALKSAPFVESLVFLFWGCFCTRKSNTLIECIDEGMSWKSAYLIAKEI